MNTKHDQEHHHATAGHEENDHTCAVLFVDAGAVEFLVVDREVFTLACVVTKL